MEELVEIVRHEDTQCWRKIINPNFKSTLPEGIAAQLMRNAANAYVEYKNCEVVYRVIRRKHLYLYIRE